MENQTALPGDIDIADLDAADEAEMAVAVNGTVTTWVWRFAGPGHPKSVEQSNRLGRQRLFEDRERDQARVNGRKYKAREETPDEVRGRNVAVVVDRLLGWSPARLNGETLTFSPEAATKLLADPRKVALLNQALEFLGDEKAFTKRSATV